MHQFHLPAGYTGTLTPAVGMPMNYRSSDGTVGGITYNTVVLGPYTVDSDWTIDGGTSVASAPLVPMNALVFGNAGVPDNAVRATLGINPTGTDNALNLTAIEYGTAGNGITVAYVDPSANNAALAVTVTRQAVKVSLATGAGGAITSTAALVKAALDASLAAKMFSTAINSGDGGAGTGAGVVTAMAAAAFTGGKGTGIGVVYPGGLCIDTTNGNVYRNSGSQLVPAWTQLADHA
jgi:hypothetical protein